MTIAVDIVLNDVLNAVVVSSLILEDVGKHASLHIQTDIDELALTLTLTEIYFISHKVV